MSVENGIVQTELNLLNRPGRQLLSLPAAVHLGEHKISWVQMTSKEWAEVERREVMAMKISSQEEVCRREERGTQIGTGLLGVM